MITSDRMAAVDRNAEALGVPRKQLMESSGNAIAAVVHELATPGDRIEIIAGRGNNGGDAFVAARFLDEFATRVSLLGRPETIRTEIARENWAALQAGEYETTAVRDSTAVELDDPDLVIDAILGTGVTGALREPEATATARINDTDATVLSVDVPSGIDADTGNAAGEFVRADHVVTFHDRKPGLDSLDVPVTVADIGIPAAAEQFVGPGDLLALGRDPSAHKGQHGKLLVVGGGPYTGAPALTAAGTLRAGADLVRVATPSSAAAAVSGYDRNLIVETLAGDRLRPGHVDKLLALATDRDTVVFGPGLGDDSETLSAAREFLAAFDGTVVVDADPLSVVPDVETDATLVCTPHQGEFAAMGGQRGDDWQDRSEVAATVAQDLGITLLVKGRYDVVTDGSESRINRTGTPAMTVGGTGDVLAGVTGALVARLGPLKGAAVAAYATGRAGEFAEDDHNAGLVATDLLDNLPAALWGKSDD